METNRPKSFFTWRAARRVLVGLAICATLLAIFYAVENWRGKRAWEQCKRDLEARGEVLDWSAYIPSPIPDEQNVFKAPKMSEWLLPKGWSTKGGWERSELSKRLGATSPSEFVHRSNAVAEITVLVPRDASAAPPADLLLDYSGHVLSLVNSNSISEKSEPIPVIQIEDAPLSVAITNLAHQAGLNFVFDPKVLAGWRDTSGRSVEPNISFKWENVSARTALFALLDLYGYVWIENPKTGIARIVALSSSGPKVILQEAAEVRLKTILQESLDRSAPGHVSAELSDVRQRKFVAGPLPEIKTLRLAVFADRVPTAVEVEGFLPHSVKLGGRIGWRAVATGSNTFNVFFIEETFFSAAEYLAWSDQFAPEFEIISAGLRRPLAQIGGDYQRPFSLPIPDYVCVRTLAQLLAERAQCHLLLGRPEEALKDLTMMHDLHRLLSGKPTLLVAAMIDVAVTGLYTAIIADGFRLHAWREPELVALQKQLGEINLPIAVQDSLRTERAAGCQVLLNLKPGEVDDTFRFRETKPGVWERVTDPAYLLIKFAPRGWVYQNLVTGARMQQVIFLNAFDSETKLFIPGNALKDVEIEKSFAHWSPYNVLARLAVPNFIRAMRTAAHNQTTADQAFIACGLERYHQAHGDYPENLDALVPGMVAKLPHDVIGGRPLHYQRAAAGKFMLYSIGWDEADDGGKTLFKKDGSVEYDSPDWVWPLSVKQD